MLNVLMIDISIEGTWSSYISSIHRYRQQHFENAQPAYWRSKSRSLQLEWTGRRHPSVKFVLSTSLNWRQTVFVHTKFNLKCQLRLSGAHRCTLHYHAALLSRTVASRSHSIGVNMNCNSFGGGVWQKYLGIHKHPSSSYLHCAYYLSWAHFYASSLLLILFGVQPPAPGRYLSGGWLWFVQLRKLPDTWVCFTGPRVPNRNRNRGTYSFLENKKDPSTDVFGSKMKSVMRSD